jgi:hypothetical protein
MQLLCPPPLQPHCSATTYDSFAASGSNGVADTDADADSAASVDALVSLTLLSQTNPPHPSNDKDSNPNGSPEDETPCAIHAALPNHSTGIDAVLALEHQTPDDTVTSYFRTMMATINHRFSGIQQQMATTIAVTCLTKKSPQYVTISRR